MDINQNVTKTTHHSLEILYKNKFHMQRPYVLPGISLKVLKTPITRPTILDASCLEIKSAFDGENFSFLNVEQG